MVIPIEHGQSLKALQAYNGGLGQGHSPQRGPGGRASMARGSGEAHLKLSVFYICAT